MSALDISIAQLRELLSLNTDTGDLFWLPRGIHLFQDDDLAKSKRRMNSWNAKNSGRRALSCVDRFGYKRGCIFGKRVAAHRAVFALHYGYWPKIVDHINRDTGDNRPENLRGVSFAENSWNSTPVRNARRRFIGVKKNTGGCSWGAVIMDHTIRKNVHLGSFETEEEAAEAYDLAALRLRGDFAVLNFPTRARAALAILASKEN